MGCSYLSGSIHRHLKHRRENTTIMSLKMQLWLLVTLSAVAADFTSYIPQLASTALQGRLTATTFILSKPKCIFNLATTNNVWIVVANNAVQLSDNDLINKDAKYSTFSTLGYYHTLTNTENSYSCDNIAEYIQIGNDMSCFGNSDSCNGPLTSTGPYRVIFVVMDSTGAFVDKTGWSGPITLRQGKASSLIDTWPGRRSGGMIVITSILSVLLATFLVCLIGTFIVGRQNIICCKKTEKIENTVPQAQNLKNYKTHHAPENTELYSQPIA
ncbi:uroplakin-3b isoform X2 [Phyllobates terribilis]|uniref:uroplakin-3b isoform X2 n=1 Tax=Phyllobates terribilis TaxID=111132 RepID=UPI003CCB0647